MELTLYPTNGLNSYAGYGRLECGLARGLEGIGATVSLVPNGRRPVIVVGYPDWLRAPHVRNERRWLLTMSESNKVSPGWVEKINRDAERVLVPCPQLVDVYKASGVTVPVHDVGCGVSMDDAEPAAYREPGETFTFLTYSYGEMRKNADMVVWMFLRLFDGDTRYRLTVKARENFDISWMSGFVHPQIDFVTGIQGENDWEDTLRAAHCFVFPSRGEGFGLPPREATLLHVPTIATRWLGLHDVDCWGLPVDVLRLQPVVFGVYEANATDAEWAHPDPEQLGRQMQWVAEHYGEAYRLAVRGAEYLRRESSWDAMARRVAGLVEEYG